MLPRFFRLLSILLVMAAQPAVAEMTPVEALTDFNVTLTPGWNEKSAATIALVSACSRHAIEKGLAFAPGGENDRTPDIYAVLSPKLRDCAWVMTVEQDARDQKLIGGDGPVPHKKTFTAIEFYKAAVSAKIAIEDTVLVVSYWQKISTTGRHWSDTTTYYSFGYLGHRVTDLLHVPVDGANEQTPPLQFRVGQEETPSTIVASLTDLNGLAPEQVNIPLSALRPYVIRKTLGVANERPLILADYLKFSVLYYTTYQEPLWKALAGVSQSQMRMGDALGAQFASLAQNPRSQSLAKLSWGEVLGAYVYIYKDNLQEVLLAYKQRKKEILGRNSAYIAGGQGAQEALARYELAGRVTADTITGLTAASQAGLSIINRYLR